MKRNKIPVRSVIGATFGLFLGAAFAVDNGYTIQNSTMHTGGRRATGGNFDLTSTIGQPGGGVQTGGNYEMSSGFSAPFADADCNGDNGVNLLDHTNALTCWTGPDGEVSSGPCRCFDFDASGAVDLADFARIQNDFNGVP